MLLIIETPHRGDTRTWMVYDKNEFVVSLLDAYRRAGDLAPDVTYEDAVAWLRADLRALEIHEVPDHSANPWCPEYPRGLTGESAAFATDGPEDQAIRELRAIERAASAWPTAEAARLAEEAREYLKEYL